MTLRCATASIATAVLALVACADAPPPDAASSPDSLAVAVPPDSAFADGGAVAMPRSTVAALVARDTLWRRALALHFDALVLDGHVDTPTLMLDRGYDFATRHDAATSHVDLPRMVEGGLDAAFFSLYVSRAYGERRDAHERAVALIDEIERQVAALPVAEIARTGADVRRITRAGRRAVLLGLEGGHATRARIDVLEDLAARGVRYVTLTHTNSNSFADASTDAPRHGGLNETGRELVRAMNRLGVVVDLSHVSDSTAYDALAVTSAPVMMSHSSAAALYRHPRNVNDDLLRAVGRNGGVVMVNFYATYLGSGRVTLDTVLDHIEHVSRVAGVDHVGLGSDFDGVDRLPDGLEDATRLPWITYGLLRRGWREADVRKVLGLNALRVLEAAERVAATSR